jgi:hypothetical protein
MATQNENLDSSRTEDFDPFPEPQTIPSGWDLSELLSAPESVPATESDSNPDNQPR